MLASQELAAGALRWVLKEHPFFAGWDHAAYTELADHCRLIQVPNGGELLAQDGLDPHIHFLLEGELRLTNSQADERTVAAGTAAAEYPVARLRPSLYAVSGVTECSVLAVEQAYLRRHDRKSEPRFVTTSRSTDGSWREHPLTQKIVRAQRAGQIELPVIPAVALKVRRALEKEDMSLSQIGEIVAADPAISVRLLEIANSALFFGVKRCETLESAVVRLGANRVQNLVLSLSASKLFRTEQSMLRRWLARIWKHLIDVGALCSSLARINGKIDPDLGLLVGLLHEVGKIPILQYAENHSELITDESTLNDIVEGLSPELTAATLSRWDLPEQLILAARAQHQYSYDHDGACDLTDLLLVAHVHTRATNYLGESLALPRLDETPAFAKITGKPLQPKESLELLEDVKSYTQQLKRLLS